MNRSNAMWPTVVTAVLFAANVHSLKDIPSKLNPTTLAPPSPPSINFLGGVCIGDQSCGSVPNSRCNEESKCECVRDFFEHEMAPGVCRLAPGFNEQCATGAVLEEFPRCRQPFVCNGTGLCDCPPGFIQEYFQCIRDCPVGQTPTFDGCMFAKQLGEKCTKDEQCVQSYATCKHGLCQCIPGANQQSGNCFPVNQCPLGEPARDDNGAMLKCSQSDCPNEHYCMYPQMTTGIGFCCPKIRMNCPIGQPLEGYNCSNCPWHTHHCFTYAIGVYSETMCCPNACPTTQPILVDGQCHAQVAFGGRCVRDEQCRSVAGSVCREGEAAEADGKRCQCASDEHLNRYGKCLRQSKLGGNCTADDECKMGSNTVCSDKGVCKCYTGYMPEPRDSTGALPEKCIAEPSCPSANGNKAIGGSYQDCSKDQSICDSESFCRKWWFDGNKTFSLCCPKPSVTDYESVCEPFRMRLILNNEVADVRSTTNTEKPDTKQDAAPLRCDITLFNALAPSTKAPSPLEGKPPAAPLLCPTGASCIFDPFQTNGIDGGVCCRLDSALIEQGDTNSKPSKSRLGPPAFVESSTMKSSVKIGNVNARSPVRVRVSSRPGKPVMRV